MSEIGGLLILASFVYPGGLYDRPDHDDHLGLHLRPRSTTATSRDAAAVSSLFLLVAFALFLVVRVLERSGWLPWRRGELPREPLGHRGARDRPRRRSDWVRSTWTIAPGSAVAVLGPSGAGKTTLLRTLAGFLPARRGRILRDGTDVSDWLPEERELGYVPQGLGLFPHRTVERNVRYPMELRDRPDAARRTRELLERFHLDGARPPLSRPA